MSRHPEQALQDRHFKEVFFRPDKGYDPLLDVYHNTRHASRRHASLVEKQGWHLRSPWLSRFDWILDAHLEAEYRNSDSLWLTKQRRTPRTVFVKCGLLDLFVSRVLPAINSRIVLYIGNGEVPLSACGTNLEALVRHPMIHRVFAENRDVDIADVAAMPVGMHPREIIRENSVLELQRLAEGLQLDQKKNKVFGAWGDKRTLLHSRNDRELAREFMQSHEGVCDYFDVMGLHQFWRTMSGYRFMLSPWSHLHDTAKTFEALILKTIPIIMTGPFAQAYRDLPVVVIDDLEEINPENLQRWWLSLSGRFEDMSFVNSDFWWRKVEQALPKLKDAFLVLGPESHGNHLVGDILVHAGCEGHSGDHAPWQGPRQESRNSDVQPWDQALPTDQNPIVWRRSVPHLKHLPDIRGMIESLEARDYKVTAIVVTREPHAALQSQLKWRHVSNRAAGMANIEKAYRHIFTQLDTAGIHFVVTSYESLVNYSEAQDLLLRQLKLDVPAERLPVWDSNRNWYDLIAEAEAEDHRASEQEAPARASDFPEDWFTCYEPDYRRLVVLGKRRMAASRVVFCGLARDVEKELAVVTQRIESAAAMFRDYRVVIYENDSRDGTLDLLHAWERENPNVTVLHEVLEAPRWGSVPDPERMAHLAYCRNRYLDHVAQHHADFDHMIVLDTDLHRGFSYEGLANTFGHEDWDAVGSNGILVPIEGRPPPDPMFFDAWAFRSEGDVEAQSFEVVNRLQFHRGEPLVPVWSCFGGLAVYRMDCVLSGARYGGTDCEHVVFHRELRDRGYAAQYLNPSQFVFYAGEDSAED